MARRFARIYKRLQASRKPIVWLRAMPGSGKTRLLRELAGRAAALHVKDWSLLDDPSPDVLQAELAARGTLENPSGRRLLIASRSSNDLAGSLLTPRLYGFVEVVDDSDLFVTVEDCRSMQQSAELLAATGGWPLLVDGWLSGRAVEMVQMLPAFLEREVLPDLPSRLTTALFGALPGPLGPAAVDYLFGAQAKPHPLLRTTASGVTVAAIWVRVALLKLRTQPKALRRSVLDDLIHIHTRFAEPARAITSLVELGLFAQAVDVYNAAGGMFFGYRHGYQALETVLQSFGPDWERRTESLFFARLYMMIKSGQPREALLRLEAQYPGLPVDLRRLRLSHRPYAVLMRLDMTLDVDEAPPLEVISSWGRLDAFLEPGDDMARGILYNTMAIGFLQAGALLQAQELAEEALAVYERAGSPYLAHFMQLHLCDLSLRHGRLRDAADQLRRAEESLRASGLAFNSEPAIIECFRARIAYEEGRFGDCPEAIEPILQALLRGDSWPDLISAMAGHVVFTAFWQQGLRKALDRLDHCALTLSRRHGPTQTRSIELIRIRLYQVARRHEEAGARLEEYDLQMPARRISHLDAEEGLVRLRQQIVQGPSVDAALKFAAGLANLPALEARHKIALAILQAYLRHRRAEPGPARRHLSVALRTAEAENLLGVLVEEGEFLERLLPVFVAQPGPGNERIAGFAQRVARLLRTLPSAPMYSKALAGVTRQEHRVLSYVADGYTNKQIARALTLSESVIKFHLRNLFRKMKVSSRTALCETVARRGIRT
jgi:DNA-binding CsgD family transcriptional regulator/tetratricopeptide (TPR) repeat protein